MVGVVMSTTNDAFVVKNLPLSVRLDPAVRRALDAAARHDARSLSSLTGRIIVDWLQKHGYYNLPPSNEEAR